MKFWMMNEDELKALKARTLKERPKDKEIDAFLGSVLGIMGDWNYYRLKNGGIVRYYYDGTN